MANMTTYLKNELFDHIMRGAAYASPANVFFGLWSTNPNDDASGNELAGGGYARVQIPMGAPVDGVGTNNVQITFAIATGDWLQAGWFGIHDLVAAGNLLLYDAVVVPRTVLTNDTARVLIDGLTVTFL